MELKSLSDSDFQSTLNKCGLAFVDVYADWCGPCAQFEKVFRKVAEANQDYGFFKIDGEANQHFREMIHIPTLPFVACFHQGAYLRGESLTTSASLNQFIQSVVKATHLSE